MKITVAVVYHDTHGHTKRRADSVMRGVQEAGDVTSTIYTTKVAASRLDELDGADALIFGCPTYMGSMSAGMDSFLEVVAKKWLALAWKKQNCGGSPIRPHFPRINSTLFSDWSAMRYTMA
jgi:NAD(P)H dehydrogenase (quinone)